MITKSEKKLNEVFGVENTEDVIDIDSVDVSTGEIVNKSENLPTEVNEPSFLAPTQIEKKEDEKFKKDAQEDFELTRNNIKNLIYQGEDLLELAMRSAQATESSESIESAASIMRSLTTMNKQLMELNKQRQDVFLKTRAGEIIKKTLKDNPDARLELKQINNNVSFVGTSNDLAKMIQDMKKEQ